MLAWLRRGKQPAAATPPPPRPDAPICVIGDVHGRMDLLEQMLNRIASQPGADRARVILVGDLIDRGPDSAAVVARVMAGTEAAPDRMFCLMGNHERMMLDFLADPVTGRRWLNHGAEATLRSYGVTMPINRPQAVAREFRARLPAAQHQWLANLPLIWTGEPGFTVVHASADPARPLDRQRPDDLLWGTPSFADRPRGDGVWVAHGHIVMPEPIAAEGRISTDTGAWRSGVLTAAWLDRDGLRFLQVRGTPAEG